MLLDGERPEPPGESGSSGAAVSLQQTVDRLANDIVLTNPRLACQLAKFDHLVIIERDRELRHQSIMISASFRENLRA